VTGFFILNVVIISLISPSAVDLIKMQRIDFKIRKLLKLVIAINTKGRSRSGLLYD
jgi:hypothetical protein